MKTTVTNQHIADVFSKIASLLEAKGENTFKIRTYLRAARMIRHLSPELTEMVSLGSSLRHLPGVGDAIAQKIHELVTTGSLQYYERLKMELPEGMLALMEIPGIGPKTAHRICSDLGISTTESLEKAILEGHIASVTGLGPKTANNILRQLRAFQEKDRRIPLGVALRLAEEIGINLRDRCPYVDKLIPVGSLRRYQEMVRDVHLLCATEYSSRVIDAFTKFPLIAEVSARNRSMVRVVTEDGMQVQLQVVPRDQFGSLLQYFTGSKRHNTVLETYGNAHGVSLSGEGVVKLKTGRLIKFAEEEEVYDYLGLQYIPPELREGVDELEVAGSHTLPSLVATEEILGDLHVHTDQSDGRENLGAMAASARERGLQYIAITDHSKGRGVANGLSEERLKQHIQRVRALDASMPDIRLLTGSEVDIRADGSMDYPNHLLAELDVVIGSVHSAMGQEKAEMTQRVIRAMENPHVDIIGHPTCRLLGSRQPVDIDMLKVLAAAQRTGTAMEINSSWQRLDLRDEHAQAAKNLGVSLVINTDAHASDHFDQIHLGVAVARRAWCERRHVLNTRPVNGFLRALRGDHQIS